jgi:signal transduction histidine kinase
MVRLRLKHKLAAGLVLVVAMIGLMAFGAWYGLRAYQFTNRITKYHGDQQAALQTLMLATTRLIQPGSEPETADAEQRAKRRQLPLNDIEDTVKNYERCLNEASRDVPASFDSGSVESQRNEISRIRGELDALKASVNSDRPVAVVNKPTQPWFRTDELDRIHRITASIGSLSGIIHSEVTMRYEEGIRRGETSAAIVYLGSVMVIVMLVALVWATWQAIVLPIRELHRVVTRISDGRLDSRVRLKTGDEMEELGTTFNRMADSLQETYRTLNDQVEERSRQLIRSERLASVGFLAAGVAHEINNPLASIAFCGEAIEGRLQGWVARAGHEGEVIANYLKMIQSEAFRCKAITEKLLDFSRVGEPERIDTDLTQLVRDTVEMVEHLGRFRGKRLEVEPADSISARVNAQELKQVLLNLTVNALESVDAGGQVRIAVREAGADVEIVIRDNGCGMTADTMSNLFEPFFTRSRTGKGTGLGLSISHLIVSQHGGTITATSEGLNRGSVFTIRLPARSAGAARTPEPERREPALAA